MGRFTGEELDGRRWNKNEQKDAQSLEKVGLYVHLVGGWATPLKNISQLG